MVTIIKVRMQMAEEPLSCSCLYCSLMCTDTGVEINYINIQNTLQLITDTQKENAHYTATEDRCSS